MQAANEQQWLIEEYLSPIQNKRYECNKALKDMKVLRMRLQNHKRRMLKGIRREYGY